tara:strand:- start:700 stop:3984 length:3285 start_codon:yes stop_codon:yes gene_type:complete
MSNSFTKTTLLECNRSQSDEAIANNDQSSSQWSNRLGQGLQLKAGDQISVHSSYISEIGAESGQIQIKGQNLGTNKTVEITQETKSLFNPELPQKYARVVSENVEHVVPIRDDTVNLVVSPYKCANGEYYNFLPRRWNTSGIDLFWAMAGSRDGVALNASTNNGQTQYPPNVLNRCAADLSTKYTPYRVGVASTAYKVTGRNDGARYTLFTRKETFFGDPLFEDYDMIGKAVSGSSVILAEHNSSTLNLVVGMTLNGQSPDTVFGAGLKIVAINGSDIVMGGNATANSNKNTFTFGFPAQTDDFLPPTTLNSSFTADECESFRDPAVFGEYIQVKNLITLKADPGYNSPSDLAVQLTEEINKRTDLEKFTYNTSNLADNVHVKETFTVATESPAYKLYNCATAHNYENSAYDAWFKTDGSWNVTQAQEYLSSYQNIGIKRPELYISGKKLNDSDAFVTNPELANKYGDEIFMTGITWSDENILKFKAFFDTQEIYPELFDDFDQSGVPVSISDTRFIHMNLADNGPNDPLDPDNPTSFAVLRSAKVPSLGYDLYNAAENASGTSFPLFIDYNPATTELLAQDVDYIDFGGGNFAISPFNSDYTQLAHGFARKIRRGPTVLGGDTNFYIGFQFSKTGNKIPEHFFQENACAAPARKELGSGGGRGFGFDYHFTSYGMSAMLFMNGNANIYGNQYTDSASSAINLSTKLYRFAQSQTERLYFLDKYQFGIYLGADSPVINYNPGQQRFQINSLHTAEVIGNLSTAGYDSGVAGTLPINPNAGNSCYKLNKRPLLWNYTPDVATYNDQFSAGPAGASENTYISANVNIDAYTIMDAQSGIFIEDWVVPEHDWDESLIGIMGFRYNQFHNVGAVSSRQKRIKADGSNSDLNSGNIITTNANVNEADIVQYQQNTSVASMFSPILPVGMMPSGKGFTASYVGRNLLPAITISPVTSVNITAQRIPTKTLRPYYTIRSDIIQENQVLGGLTGGVTLPIVAITNKANPYGDFLNGISGEVTFTNTIDRVLTRVRCSIHEPDGTLARTDLNSAVIFRVDQTIDADFDIVSGLLQSKKKSDQNLALELDDPGLEFENVKYKFS